VGKKLDFLKSL